MSKINPKELKALHALGFALHWLRPKSKMPVHAGWTKGPRLEWEEFRKTYRKGYNVGVRLGDVSVINGKSLAVLDVDVKSTNPMHADEAREKLYELYPEAIGAPIVLSGRGNGSLHAYVLMDKGISGEERKAQSPDLTKAFMPSVKPSVKDKAALTEEEITEGYRQRPAWEISLMSNGRQVVLPGSVHPDSGKLYQWESGFDLSLMSTLRSITPSKSPNRAASTVEEAATPLTHKKYNFLEVNPRSLGLYGDQVLGIVEGSGVEDRSAYMLSIAMALVKRGHSDDVIISLLTDKKNWLGATGFEHAGNTANRNRAAYWVDKYCLQKAKEKVTQSAFDHEVIEIDESGNKNFKETNLHSALGLNKDWHKGLDLQPGPRGAPPTVRATFKNIRLILENEVSEEILRRNVFANEDFWNVETPWGYEAGQKRSGNVDDALQVKAWLIDSEYKVEASVSMIDEVINYFATENSFHPVKEYLEELEWDGIPRVENAFSTYLGATMPPTYQKAVCSIFFQALIQRIYEPGCKFDHVPVLEGKQGIGKSTFARYLVSDKWFMDGLPDFQDKDAALNLQGIWICELSELATIYRSANEQAKAFITRQTDKVRPPYGHRRVDFPRSTIFLGTTNARDYLTDVTGNRRFWPVEITRCDFKALEQDRDQLLAEAKFLYDNLPGKLYLEGKALKLAETIQESRRVEDESDAMESRFTEWLNLAPEHRQGFDAEEVCLSEMFERGPFKTFQNNMATRRAAGLVLRKAGYHKVSTRDGKRWRAI